MAILVKDGLAMRLTFLTNRLARAALVAAGVASAGCQQRLPYIDQSKPVPHETMSTIATEDKEVKKTQFLSNLPMPMPKVAKPRTTQDPEAQEIWQLTLDRAIAIGLDNCEVIRVISLGAQGIPVSGFEPTPLNNGAGSGIASALGASPLQTIYDPAIQETQIASALSSFDTNFTTSLLWGHSVSPFNNAIQAGTFLAGPRFPIIFNNDTAQFQTGLQKRTATGALIGVTHNINYLYSNSPTNVTPSAYTTNTQLSLTQPLLGSAPLAGGQAGPPVGLEANRAPIIVARLSADAAVWRFKAEVMAHVRSIEQQYWSLAQQHVQLWSSEKAVELAEEILKREQSELEVGRGTVADVAESQQRLEQFRLDLVTKTSDVITTERQLRNILGLPPADSRRIVPVTAPHESRLQPDWEASMAQMLTFQPDVVTQQLVVRVAELQLLVARNQLLPQLNMNALYQFNGLGHTLDRSEAVMTGSKILAIDPLVSTQQHAAGLAGGPGIYNNFQQWQLGFTFQMPLGMRGPLANTRNAQMTLLKQRAYLQQIVHQTIHSLARFFLEVDANYKQFKTASRLRDAASQRLEAQRAFTRRAGSRSTATSTPSASTPARSLRRPSSRPRTTSRSSPWRKPRGPCWPTTTSPWPKGRTPRRRTSRPATSRARTGNCRSGRTATTIRARSTAPRTSTRSSPIRPHRPGRTVWCPRCRRRSDRSDRCRGRPLRRSRPASPKSRREPASPGRSTPASSPRRSAPPSTFGRSPRRRPRSSRRGPRPT